MCTRLNRVIIVYCFGHYQQILLFLQNTNLKSPLGMPIDR